MSECGRLLYEECIRSHSRTCTCGMLHYLAMTKKRGYTYDFTPKSEKHGRYLLDKIPADLWRRVKVKSTREGVSIRAYLLQRLTEWVAK